MIHPSFPSYDAIIPSWLAAAVRSGCWDETHGSDLDRFVSDIQEDALEGHRWPEGVPHDAAFDDPRVMALLEEWARARYANVIAELSVDPILKLGRTMRVDRDWLDGLTEGTSTVGFYFGTLPLDDGDFWIDESQPVNVYLEAEVAFEDVDWPATILARMDYLTGDEEGEIRLKTERSITLTQLEIDHEEVEVCAGLTVSTGLPFERVPEPGFVSHLEL